MKTTIFHVLMAFRGIFFAIFNFLAGILGFILVVSLGIYIFTDIKGNLLGAILGLFLIFLGIYFFKHFYDKIIFWAKPDDMDLTLFK